MDALYKTGLSGIGQGAMLGLLAIGLVITYRGSGVINLAHGAFAMVTAFVFQQLRANQQLPLLVAAVIALGAIAIIAALSYILVMRRLQDAPILARVVATLGMVLIARPAVELWIGRGDVPAPVIFDPNSELFGGINVIFGARLPRANIWLVIFAVALTLTLVLVYRYTRYGVIANAVWDSPRGASTLGYSPNTIGLFTWVLGALLAGAAGMLISSVQAGGLTVDNLTFLVIPALSAALVARFTSFTIALATGMAIGMLQAWLTYVVVTTSFGWIEFGVVPSVPLVFIVVAFIVRGKTLPTRADVTDTARLPRSPRPSAKLIPIPMIVGLVAAAAALAFSSRSMQQAIINSIIFATLGLSLVVVTGLGGQISLAQLALAGFGAFTTAKLSATYGLPMLVAIPLAAVAAGSLGLLVGSPAVRTRGASLAVVTLSAGIAIEELILKSNGLAGGSSGLRVSSPSIIGLDISAIRHPVRYGVFCLIVLTALTLAVRNLRRGITGRRMLAVRSNERAAASTGLSVPRVKLLGFTLAAAIAGVAGALIAYQSGSVQYSRFETLGSVLVVASVYLGSVGSTAGAWIAGIGATSGIVAQLLNFGSSSVLWVNLALGIGLIIALIDAPDGIAVSTVNRIRPLLDRSRHHRRQPPPEPTAAIVDTNPPQELQAHV